MTTTLGARYKLTMDSNNETGPSGEEARSGDAAELVKVLMQERRKREEEVAEE